MLEGLDSDTWGRLVPAVRAALRELPAEALTPPLRRLASAPTSRLASGRTRRDLARAIAEGGALWLRLRAAITEDAELRSRWAARPEPTTAAPAAPDVAPTPPRDDQRVARLRDRLRSMQGERDAAVRRAAGADARAAAAEAEREAAREEAAALAGEVAGLRNALDVADEERRAAVQRERRRAEAEHAELLAELRGVRRELAEEREANRRRERAAARATPTPSPDAPPPVRATRLVAGRPSTLPDDVVAGTTEEAVLLLGRGRLVYVDGYNVTRTHRGDLDLASQRDWLVERLRALAGHTGCEPVVVFDGHGEQVARAVRQRVVRVAFTLDGQTADDDLVFRVASLEPDEPVTVVTDDRELRERLAPYGCDLLHTRQLVWVLT